MKKVSINVLCGNTEDIKLLKLQLKQACDKIVSGIKELKNLNKITKFKITLEEVSNEKDTK